jgi:hypothetical protein
MKKPMVFLRGWRGSTGLLIWLFRLFSGAAALLFSVGAYASNWHYINTAFDRSYAVLVDLDSIERRGDYSRIWEMKSYLATESQHDDGIYLSNKILYTVDCMNKLFSIDSVVDYSGQAGKGAVVKSFRFSNVKWDAIPPDSTIDQIHTVACAQ